MGRVTEKLLANHGVRTIADLLAFDPLHLRVLLGEQADHLRRLCRHGRSLRLLGVTVSGLARAGSQQEELFSDLAERRERELDGVMDRVNVRFGKVLRRGGLPGSGGRSDPGATP